MRIALTAQEFLTTHATVLDAHYGARVGHTTLKEHARGRRSLSVANANALQTWSLTLDVPAYISAAKTLGVAPEPGEQDMERLRARTLDAEAEACWSVDVIVAIGEAMGMPGANSTEIVAELARREGR